MRHATLVFGLFLLPGCPPDTSATVATNVDGDSTGSCAIGFEGCPCTTDGLCLEGLACIDQQCVDLGPTSTQPDTLTSNPQATEPMSTDSTPGTASAGTDSNADTGTVGESSNGVSDTNNSDTNSSVDTSDTNSGVDTSDTNSSVDTGDTGVSADTSDTNGSADTSGTSSSAETSDSGDSGDTNTTDTTDPPADCGDGEIDPGEDCDGAALDGKTCGSFGFQYGKLGCTAGCAYDDSKCTDSVACNDGIIVEDVLCYGPEKTDNKDVHMEYLRVGDVDKDGHLDVVGYGWTNGVMARFGNGDGTWKPTVASNPLLKIWIHHLVDIDKDGDLDILGRDADFSGLKYHVALGDTNGTYAVSYSYDLFPEQYKSGLGDADGDGFLDLVACGGQNIDKITFRRGKAGGQFGPAVSYATGGLDSDTCGFYDVDLDGHVDIWSGVTGTFRVWHGDGDGNFALDPTVTMFLAYGDAFVGDIDGDPYTDIVGFAGLKYFSVRRGTAMGFGDMLYQYQTADYTTHGVVGDFDGNDDIDAAASLQTNPSRIDVFRNDGTGLYYDGTNLPIYNNLVGVAVGDMNEDGVDDFVLGHYNTFNEVGTVGVVPSTP